MVKKHRMTPKVSKHLSHVETCVVFYWFPYFRSKLPGLTMEQVSGKPIKLVGRGERMEDLEPFYPDRMAGRVLGMGDVLSFVEKAQEVVGF